MGHHYTPQKYLEGFRDRKRVDLPMIWQFDKKKVNWAFASIKNVANEKGFYTVEDERLLSAKVEGPANPILDKLRARKTISDAERKALADYIATMLTRIPRLRGIREDIAPQALKESCDDYCELVRNLARSGLLTESEAKAKLDEADEFERRAKANIPEVLSEHIKRPWPTARILEIVGSMAWRFVATSGPSYFLTSDDPASFFHSFGLGTPKAELIFPISSEVALHAGWQDRPWRDIRPVKQVIVKEFNRRIALGASRFVFYHEEASWLPEVMKNRIEQLNRIEWT